MHRRGCGGAGAPVRTCQRALVAARLASGRHWLRNGSAQALDFAVGPAAGWQVKGWQKDEVREGAHSREGVWGWHAPERYPAAGAASWYRGAGGRQQLPQGLGPQAAGAPRSASAEAPPKHRAGRGGSQCRGAGGCGRALPTARTAAKRGRCSPRDAVLARDALQHRQRHAHGLGCLLSRHVEPAEGGGGGGHTRRRRRVGVAANRHWSPSGQPGRAPGRVAAPPGPARAGGREERRAANALLSYSSRARSAQGGAAGAAASPGRQLLAADFTGQTALRGAVGGGGEAGSVSQEAQNRRRSACAPPAPRAGAVRGALTIRDFFLRRCRGPPPSEGAQDFSMALCDVRGIQSRNRSDALLPVGRRNGPVAPQRMSTCCTCAVRPVPLAAQIRVA